MNNSELAQNMKSDLRKIVINLIVTISCYPKLYDTTQLQQLLEDKAIIAVLLDQKLVPL